MTKMNFKTFLLFVFLGVLGLVMTSFFAGSVLTAQVVKPFSALEQDAVVDGIQNLSTTEYSGTAVKFVDGNLETAWIPWLIKQVSILIGALSFVVFLYSGINLIINAENEEQLTTSLKSLVFAVVGIAVAAFSYTVIANILTLFAA